jgi:DNA replication and repair protein RecF
MRLTRLQLFDYRNFHRLDVELPARVAIFVGDNAQGKSNLLESVYLAATTRGLRSETDAQLVAREMLSGVLPAARVVAHAETTAGPLKVEVVVTVRQGAHGPVGTKTVKINGSPRRLADAQGQLMAVLFAAEDMEMITGTPSLRRRYIDITLSQVDRQYASTRARFERLLTQRNHLLKRIREGSARMDELEYWDTELARDGGVMISRRARALADLSRIAAESHAALAPGEVLRAAYQPKLDVEGFAASEVPETEVAEIYTRALRQGLNRDISAGMTLQGPHRDELVFELGGVSAAGFASRAQQRTIALSMRLAEAAYLESRRGEPPVLLMDDVLSEMDAGRREGVLGALAGAEQMLVTGTDWDRFPAAFTDGAQMFSVEAGCVAPRA